MFEKQSRYYHVEQARYGFVDGQSRRREIRYVRRRFIPQSQSPTTLAEHRVAEGDRLDNITARYLGDPKQFWRLADWNGCLHPEELTENLGGLIRIELPEL